MSIWFTADTHFGHTNILKYCDRPFASADEMDQEMVRNWNDHVAPGDVVWHLGDVCFKRGPKLWERMAMLNGDKFVLKGNHDKPADLDMVCWYNGPMTAGASGRMFWMNHYPPDKSMDLQPPDGAIVLAGHQHNHEPWQARWGHRVNEFDRTKGLARGWYTSPWIDVGVDAWDYRPVSLDEVVALWDQKMSELMGVQDGSGIG